MPILLGPDFGPEIEAWKFGCLARSEPRSGDTSSLSASGRWSRCCTSLVLVDVDVVVVVLVVDVLVEVDVVVVGTVVVVELVVAAVEVVVA